MPLPLIGLLGCAAPADPTLCLGTAIEDEDGVLTFAPLADGDEVLVTQGPQGGFHVLGSIQVAGVVPGDPQRLDAADNPSIAFDLWVDGRSYLLTGDAVQGLDPIAAEGEKSHELVGKLVVLDISDDDEVAGQGGELRVQVTDSSGTSLDAAVQVALVRDPFNLP